MSQEQLTTHLAWVEEMALFAEVEENSFRDFEGELVSSFIGSLDLWLGDSQF